MRNKINAITDIIEKKHDVKILYSCESGSRAWGFESEDSDWDIRFVYLRKKQEYLTVFPTEQLHIDRNNSEICKNFVKYDLDFVGWDIKKVLYHFSKGNPAMISWFFSPIIYKCNNNFLNLMKKLGQEFFKEKAAFYHYIHMAQKNYAQYIANPESEQVRTKKYLYVLRPILACIWIESYGSEPPMTLEKIYLDKHINKILCDMQIFIPILELIATKKEGLELGMGPRIPKLDDFCEKMIKRYEEKGKRTTVEDKDYKKLDNIFRGIVTTPTTKVMGFYKPFSDLTDSSPSLSISKAEFRSLEDLKPQ